MLRSQALCLDAESVRQEQVTKKRLQQCLVDETHVHGERAPRVADGSDPIEAHERAIQKTQWEPDLLFEVIEIAKDFSTSNSGKFINGILDAILTQLKKSGKLVKTGRGLVEESLPKKSSKK